MGAERTMAPRRLLLGHGHHHVGRHDGRRRRWNGSRLESLPGSSSASPARLTGRRRPKLPMPLRSSYIKRCASLV
eukprot:5515202-Prymnesium_polylepis.4